MNFEILILDNTEFLDSIPDTAFFYFDEYLSKEAVRERLITVLEWKGKIFVVKNKGKITCFFTYRELSFFPGWSLSNFFILDHRFFSPNMLGFGYALDQAVALGEQNNRFSFVWVVEKATHNRRYKIGLRDIERRNSILKNYTFHIFQDSTIHKNFKFFDMLNGNSIKDTYTILCARNIN